jgi:hypothetical protein
MHAPDGIRTTSRCMQSPKHMQSPQGQVQDPQCSSRVASLSELTCEPIFALRYSLGLASVASPLQSGAPLPWSADPTPKQDLRTRALDVHARPLLRSFHLLRIFRSLFQGLLRSFRSLLQGFRLLRIYLCLLKSTVLWSN